jgi:magnesium and cobalt exporter, CNNM family
LRVAWCVRRRIENQHLLRDAPQEKGSIPIMDLQLLSVQILVMLLLIGLNAFFVAVEFATVTVPRPRIDQLAAHGDKTAALAQKLLSDSDRVLAASQVGITMASLALGWLGDRLAEGIISPLVDPLSAPWNGAVVHSIGFAVAFIVITSLHIVLGEQAPKMTAIRFAPRVALFTAHPIRLFALVFRPFIAFLDRATESVLNLFNVPTVGAHKVVYTAEELKQIVTESQHAGEIEPEERRMIHNVFEFGDLSVHEVMIPRTDMVAVEDSARVEDFLEIFAGSSHERYPVYSDNLDNIVGYISIKDILHELTRGPETRAKPIKEFIRPALFVPEAKRVSELLAEMQKSNRQLAVVIDEYGGTEGMATTENLLEEIVGGIGDERVAQPAPVKKIDENTAQVEAQLRLDEVNEYLGTRLPESDEYETLAGLMLVRFGHIPKVGESVLVDDVKLTVAAMSGPRIEQVLLSRPPSRSSPPLTSQ